MQSDLLEQEAPAQAPAAPPPALLPPPQRAAVALNTAETEAKLRAAVAKHKGITEIKDKAGREQAHGAAMELMRLRTDLKAVAKEVRDDATKFSKAVIAEEDRLVEIVEPEEKRLKALRDAWDAAEALRKQEEARIERARKEAIADRIAEIKGYRELAQQARTSGMVQSLIDALTEKWAGVDAKAVFAEFTDDAGVAYRMTLEHMGITLKAKREAEAEAARIKAEREAEAERQRHERERLAAQQREQEEAAARLQAEREAFERERAAFLAQQQATEKAPEPVPPPAEPAPVETMLDVGEVLETSPHESAVESALNSALVNGTGWVRLTATDEGVKAAHVPGDVVALGTLPAGTVIGTPDDITAEVIAGFDEAITAPIECKPRRYLITDVPTADDIVHRVAQAFDVDRATAIDWLVIRADDILNLDDGAAA